MKPEFPLNKGVIQVGQYSINFSTRRLHFWNISIEFVSPTSLVMKKKTYQIRLCANIYEKYLIQIRRNIQTITWPNLLQK